MKKALITGITGQDGSYLAELLLSKGYEIHGIIRRSSSFNTGRIDHLYQDPHISGTRMFLHFGDLSNGGVIRRLLDEIRPNEFYNMGAQSHVRASFDIPEYTADVTGLGTLRVLESIRDYQRHTARKVRFYQASSSEMFGSSPPPQSEKTPFHPRSPYGVSKVFSYHITANYRESYGIFAVNGILFNHESERRGETFVTRKIARGVARIHAGLEKKLYLGNLDAKRDWGYAPEYVDAMWRMLQQDKPEDYVIGTGETHTVREFVKAAFMRVGIKKWMPYVGIDKRYFRAAEVDCLCADARKASLKLNWKPKVKFLELVNHMVDAEVSAIKSEAGFTKRVV